MRIKLDENLPSSLVDLLSGHGHDVHTVADEALTGAADHDLLEAVSAEDRMILTLDRGFGDVRAYPPGSHPGIVVLRLPDTSPRRVRSAVERLVTTHDLDDVRGSIVVAHQETLRVRRPPS